MWQAYLLYLYGLFRAVHLCLSNTCHTITKVSKLPQLPRCYPGYMLILDLAEKVYGQLNWPDVSSPGRDRNLNEGGGSGGKVFPTTTTRERKKSGLINDAGR